ncbi:hypothetical protein SAMN05444680_12719 [Variovorax sp. YR216]|nr:hypothetical protein SAMN05444680_12719 [Variovorax sp. YR216]
MLGPRPNSIEVLTSWQAPFLPGTSCWPGPFAGAATLLEAAFLVGSFFRSGFPAGSTFAEAFSDGEFLLLDAFVPTTPTPLGRFGAHSCGRWPRWATGCHCAVCEKNSRCFRLSERVHETCRHSNHAACHVAVGQAQRQRVAAAVGEARKCKALRVDPEMLGHQGQRCVQALQIGAMPANHDVPGTRQRDNETTRQRSWWGTSKSLG